MRDYPLTIAAGGTVRITKGCTYVRMKSAAKALSVVAYSRGGVQLLDADLLGGQGSRLAEVAHSVEVTNNTAAAVDCVLMLGAASFEDDRVSGIVTAEDNGVALSLAGNAYQKVVGASAVAAQYSMVQLLNPAASGVRVVLYEVYASCETVAGLRVALDRYDTGLTTLWSSGQSTLLGSGTAEADVYSGNSASTLGLRAGAFKMADGRIKIALRNPIVLEEGRGVMLSTLSVNVGIEVTYCWAEELV